MIVFYDVKAQYRKHLEVIFRALLCNVDSLHFENC
jgi:hypothetical protein